MPYSEDVVQQVWERGRATNDLDPNDWRKDECGAWMQRSKYGNEDHAFGWVIRNVVAGGTNSVENLRPFHARNEYNRSSGKTHCHVAADRQGMPPTARIDTPDNTLS